ncbi:MAG: MATE family efflux transporter, partial [Spirochaetes bacterium]|nr:MATE family efflux transporter [Spirochaetota bacterium]
MRTDPRKAVLIEGPVGKTLVNLTIPMMFGIISMVAFNLVDTLLVGRLGAMELAALSYTFPVVLVIMSLSMGLGIGASAVISVAIGEGNHQKVRRLTTDSIVLSVLIVAVFAFAGQLTIGPVFTALGAPPHILVHTRRYMRIWYFGMICVVVPMVGNNAIRASGDTKTPAIIMTTAALINLAVDPLLIFGLGPFPRLEIAGAAIATVCARTTTLIVSLYILAVRKKMLTLQIPSMRELLDSWKRILYIGIPAASTRIIIPLATGVITRLLSAYGPETVAGYGVASRIEFFLLTVVLALSAVLAPFVGQNWGAGRHDRVRNGIKFSKQFSLVYGVVLIGVLALIARPLASIFSKDDTVITNIATYLRIVPFGYGLQGVLLICVSAMNVLNKPLHAVLLSLVQMFVVYIPLAYLGSNLFGVRGVYGALAISYLLSGIFSHLILNRILDKNEKTKSPRTGKEDLFAAACH